MAERGTLILVVGPSGAGKDTIIAGAVERFRGDPRIVFARRIITRQVSDGGERHVAVSPVEFARWREAGRLMLHWQVHGFEYGLSHELAQKLEAGCSIIANVSRTVVGEARRRFPPMTAVAIAASPATLAGRLALRKRETAEQITQRLERAEALGGPHADVIIDNDGALSLAIDRFVEVVRQAVETPPCLLPRFGR